jgi:hypothetical protein
MFARSKKETAETDIILTLTPHIIRVLEVTEADLRPFRVGRDSAGPLLDFPPLEPVRPLEPPKPEPQPPATTFPGMPAPGTTTTPGVPAPPKPIKP